MNVLHIIYKADHLLPLFNLYADAVMLNAGTVTTVFLCGAEDDSVVQETRANKVIFCAYTSKTLRKNKARLSATLRKIWQAGNYDLAICQRHKPSFAFSMARLGLPQAPMLSVVHALGQYQRRSRRLHARLLYGYAKNKTRIIAVSNAVQNDIATSFANKQPCELLTIPNCIDIHQLQTQQLNRSSARQQLGLNPDDFVFGNVARLVNDKGQIHLLAAFATLVADFPQLKLVVIGTGNLSDALQQQAKQLGISNQVFFAGNQPLAARLMPAFDVFVLPSMREPFGLVLLEAMAAKLPIIASAVNSIPEITEQHASLVTAGNVEQLALAMREQLQLDATSRQQAGEAAYTHLQSRFSTQQFQQHLQSVMAELLASA